MLIPGVATAASSDNSKIELGRPGFITVHKYKNPETLGTPTGKELWDDQLAGMGEVLGGVTFEITPVKKSADADWNFASDADILEISKLKITDVLDVTTGQWKDEARKGTLPEGVLNSGTTDDQGVYRFENLPLGVYVVQETNAPEGIVKAAPFLVVVPTTDPETLNSWMYNLHVYPKNSSVEASKSVEDAGQHQESSITYTILTDVPVAKDDEDIVSYSIADQLNTNGATAEYTADSVTSVEIIKKDAQEEPGVALEAGDVDFSVAITDGADNVANHGLAINLTPAGLTKLSEESRKGEGLLVRTTITLKVAGDFNKAEGIENGATLTTKPSSDTDVTSIPTEKVKSYFGKIKLIKTDATDESKKLQGAQFAIYECTPADTNNVQPSEVGKQLFLDQQFETNAEGVIEFPVVHVNDFADNTLLNDDKAGYCLMETKAPQGYELLQQPVFVRLNRTDVAAGDATVIAKDALVKNIPSNTPKLPLTGGAGITAIILLGVAIVGGSLVWLRKRTNAA